MQGSLMEQDLTLVDQDQPTFLFFRYNELSRFSILCLFLKVKNENAGYLENYLSFV